MIDNARSTGPALEAAYRFVLWLIPTVEKFPRSHKFLLGDRIQSAALDVIDLLVAATYTRRRRDTLTQANLGLARLRIHFRLAKDLKLVAPKSYEHAARSIDDIGKLVGGWLKADRSHEPEAGQDVHVSA